MAFKSIGMTNTEIASSMGVNESTLYRWFKKEIKHEDLYG